MSLKKELTAVVNAAERDSATRGAGLARFPGRNPGRISGMDVEALRRARRRQLHDVRDRHRARAAG